MSIFYRMRNALIIKMVFSFGGGDFDRCIEYQNLI